MYPQLIIQTLINHPPSNYTPPSKPAIDFEPSGAFLFYFDCAPVTEAMQSNLLLLYICAGLELCFDQRDDGAGVVVHREASPPSHSQSLGMAVGLWCQTASFVRLLIGVIYCPNRRSSCGFTA